MLNLFDTKIEGSQIFLKKTKNNLGAVDIYCAKK